MIPYCNFDKSVENKDKFKFNVLGPILAPMTVFSTGLHLCVIMTISTLLITTGNSMVYHNGDRFSTFDADNDESLYGHCALNYKGGWWYNGCHAANLNGEYGSENYGAGIVWGTWKSFYYSLPATRMMIERK